METLQKLALPISIVVAGGLIAVSLFFVNSNKPSGPQDPADVRIADEVRGAQADDHILGNPKADIIVVEYSDTECPFCKVFHETMHQIISEYGDSGNVAWVYRNFPIPQLHPKAAKQAEALECAAELGGNAGFWKFTDKVYETTNSNNSLDIGAYNLPEEAPKGPDGKPYYAQKPPKSATDAGQLTEIAVSVGLDAKAFEQCMASGKHKAAVDEDTQEAVKAGQSVPDGVGTPFSIIIVDGEQIPLVGAQPYNVVKQLIDSLL